MKKPLIMLLLASTGFIAPAGAEGTITKLKVDADVVYFTTDQAKPQSLPQCVASGNEQDWAVSLNTATGKAIYTLLVTASAQDRKIIVESANDCADAVGVERARSVEVGEKQFISSQGAPQYYLYQNDGITKIGKIVSYHADLITYKPVSDTTDTLLKHHQYKESIPFTNNVYFTNSYCKFDGAFYTTALKTLYEEGMYSNKRYVASGDRLHLTVWSQLTESGCQRLGGTKLYGHMLSEYNDLCGNEHCVIKE